MTIAAMMDDSDGVSTIDAVRLLNMSPSMLRAMTVEHDFPTSYLSPQGTRHFDLVEIMALREALRRDASVRSAVRRARALLASGLPEPIDIRSVARERCS